MNLVLGKFNLSGGRKTSIDGSLPVKHVADSQG